MKHEPTDWSKNLDRARRDTPPPVDLDALLRATRTAHAAAHLTAAPAIDWLADFAALFASPRIVTACLALTLACATTALWQLNKNPEIAASDPWAEVINSTMEGLT